MERLTLSDERLMTLAAEGDDVAFQALVRRMGPAILTVTTRMLGDRAAAEDAFVDVVATLWTARRTYRSGLPLRPWLMTIAANTCREHLRKRARRRVIGMLEFEDAAAPQSEPDDGVSAREDARDTRVACVGKSSVRTGCRSTGCLGTHGAIEHASRTALAARLAPQLEAIR